METIKSILTLLLKEHPDIKGSAVITSDGTSLVSVLPKDTDENQTSLESAAILSLGDKIGQDLVHGHIESIVVRCDTGYGILTSCNTSLILVVITEVEEMEKLPFTAIKKTCQEITSAINLVAV